MSIPDTDTGVETSGNHPVAIKGDGIYLAEVTAESVKTSTFGNTPYLGCRIVTSRDDDIALYLQTSHACLMPDKNVLANTLSNIPNSQGSIARARYRSICVGHLKASNCRRVASQSVQASPNNLVSERTYQILLKCALPRCHIPYSHVSIASTTD